MLCALCSGKHLLAAKLRNVDPAWAHLRVTAVIKHIRRGPKQDSGAGMVPIAGNLCFGVNEEARGFQGSSSCRVPQQKQGLQIRTFVLLASSVQRSPLPVGRKQLAECTFSCSFPPCLFGESQEIDYVAGNARLTHEPRHSGRELAEYQQQTCDLVSFSLV